MSVLPVQPLAVASGAGMWDSQSVSAGTSATADQDTFMELMVAQMRYQDPLNPQDSTQFLAQTAQFTTVQHLSRIAEMTQSLAQSQAAFGSAALLGREVSYLDAEGSTVSGVVDRVEFAGGIPTLVIGENQVPLSTVTAVLPQVSS